MQIASKEKPCDDSQLFGPIENGSTDAESDARASAVKASARDNSDAQRLHLLKHADT